MGGGVPRQPAQREAAGDAVRGGGPGQEETALLPAARPATQTQTEETENGAGAAGAGAAGR